MSLYDIELEPEVRDWLDSLPDRDYGRVMAYAELLAEEAETLGEPYARNLGDGVRELRIPLHPLQLRISYWLAPGRRVVLMTVFHKTKARETAQVDRAKRAHKECQANHDHAQIVYDREP
ncbi:MAG: hypothetical protein JWN52_2168 [Actinomycetia bacterium]|jgi:hypothetical protein|nr:hypothetical protein [Actinomycetes bacterium]